MTPIKLVLLWHQHQPDYRNGHRMVLPWVRLHATKDYLEMAQHLEQYPKMHAVINLVPSLIRQIEAYQDGIEDDLLHIAKKETSALTEKEKSLVLRECFLANVQRMISRSVRYLELFRMKERNYDFSVTDIRDLLVHYALAWTGEFSRIEEPYASLIAKDRNYSEEEKNILLAKQEMILDAVLAKHQELFERGQIELSGTPFYHPILPLLCNTDSAHEAMPDALLPYKRFSFVDDARAQVHRAKELFEERFGFELLGMWPAEGSISDDALRVLLGENIQWTASDETVLANSLRDERLGTPDQKYGDLEKYFPRKFSVGSKDIVIFFRDHGLSDTIGFDYASWDARDAALNFTQRCKDIHAAILGRFGEEAIKEACISVILDGENCWENYYENGKYFLNEFYQALTSTPEIEPVTFSEAITMIGKEHIRPIQHIVAGSWINGNFGIWIGHPEKNHAWELLSEAREVLDFCIETAAGTKDSVEAAHTSLLKAQGSDWFWWYGDDNASSQKNIFDEVFRTHLIEMYIHLRMAVPRELLHPVGSSESRGAGGAMHRAG
ncbi:MAG: glycoside hydrolase family 57 protein [Bacteroidota bacterium]|nr:glycoside hydrolase family 57 protein [Bacteroidota bacterium]MDP4231559.1 glycoside hydrolase family 57 protein [Bacteroidota bacterium]MDP4236814.1 glycoside hydrolase family 57 protein [Bacteroidota bacterium]